MRTRNLVNRFNPDLTLCSPRAFLYLTMLEVADIEHLPASQARTGNLAARDTLFRRESEAGFMELLANCRCRNTQRAIITTLYFGSRSRRQSEAALLPNGVKVKAKT